MRHVTNSRITRRNTSGGRAITIQGQRQNIHVARIKYCCFMCGSALKIRNHGLKCAGQNHHYGWITKSVFNELSQESRLMKMKELFPNQSGKLRFFDLDGDQIMTIKGVTLEPFMNRKTNKNEMVCFLYFQESDLKAKLTTTNGVELLKEFGDPDNDGWVGKKVKVFSQKEKHFGNTYDCVRCDPTVSQGNAQPEPAPAKQEAPKQPTYTPTKFMTDVNTRLVEAGLPPYEKLPHLYNVISKIWPETEADIIQAGKIAIEHKRTEPHIEAIRKDIPAFTTNQQVRDGIKKLGMELIPNDAASMDALISALFDDLAKEQAE